MERRKFLTMPLAAMAAPGALLAANAGTAHAATAPTAIPTVPAITLPANTLKGFGLGRQGRPGAPADQEPQAEVALHLGLTPQRRYRHALCPHDQECNGPCWSRMPSATSPANWRRRRPSTSSASTSPTTRAQANMSVDQAIQPVAQTAGNRATARVPGVPQARQPLARRLHGQGQEQGTPRRLLDHAPLRLAQGRRLFEQDHRTARAIRQARSG